MFLSIHQLMRTVLCFHFLNNATVNSHVLVFVWTYVFICHWNILGSLARSGIAGSYANSMFNYLRNC